jgi:hypothetical protein
MNLNLHRVPCQAIHNQRHQAVPAKTSGRATPMWARELGSSRAITTTYPLPIRDSLDTAR